MQQKDGNDKINAVEMFREGQLIHLTNLGSSEAFYSLHFWVQREFIKYCTNLNQLYHSFKMSLCNFYVLVNKLIYERFYLENIWKLSLIGEKNKRIQQLVTDAHVIYNQQRKHWTYRGPPYSSSPGSIQTILGISQSRKTMEDFFFQSQPGAQDEVWYFLNQNYNSGSYSPFILNIKQ
ncbi:Hypothetical_protein [Hexamita inflata]|uniref:Hypothetical_protein n=1 Tax=Hexamita inflata TaxID=28002 RepID=A0ABP1GJY8_9EUKA